MEKRNTLLLTVIAIATLLVAVVGATFAYFSTTQDVSSNIPVDVTTASSAAAFTAVADGSIDIVVDAHEMQQADANDTQTDVNNLTDTATLTVKLNAAQEGNVSQCKYSVIYTWTSDKYCNITSPEGVVSAETDESTCTGESQPMAYYHKTADVEKEFTLEAAVEVKVAGQAYDSSTHADLGIVANAMAERNLDHGASPITSKQITAGDGIATVDYVTLVKDAVIGSKVAAADGDTPTATEVVWTFTARFYNSTKNQDLLMNKNFKGTISVDPDSVEC